MAITKPIHTYSCQLIINDLIIIKRSCMYLIYMIRGPLISMVRQQTVN